MLGQTFYTLNDQDKQLRGQLPRSTYPAMVVDDHGGNVLTLVVLTGAWHTPAFVRATVASGAAGAPGRWNAIAA
jgi:hypothetical protein